LRVIRWVIFCLKKKDPHTFDFFFPGGTSFPPIHPPSNYILSSMTDYVAAVICRPAGAGQIEWRMSKQTL
jgi:hypothetical protein